MAHVIQKYEQQIFYERVRRKCGFLRGSGDSQEWGENGGNMSMIAPVGLSLKGFTSHFRYRVGHIEDMIDDFNERKRKRR